MHETSKRLLVRPKPPKIPRESASKGIQRASVQVNPPHHFKSGDATIMKILPL
jgi:hypothetical protein